MAKSIWRKIKHALSWQIIKVHWTFWVRATYNVFNNPFECKPNEISTHQRVDNSKYNDLIPNLFFLGMFDIWPVMNKCTVVAKRELFFAWPFGLAAWLCGLIFINRMQSDRARDQLCKATTIIKNKKIKLWIFPEGTRRNTGDLHPFKKGAFHVAIDAQIPILPVVFSSYRTFLDEKNKQLDSGKIIISTLPPISTDGLTKTDLDSLMSHTYDLMNKEYQLNSKEVADQTKMSKQKTRNKAQGAPKQASTQSAQPTTTTTTKINSEHNIDYRFDENNVLNQYTFMHQHHRNVIPPTAN